MLSTSIYMNFTLSHLSILLQSFKCLKGFIICNVKMKEGKINFMYLTGAEFNGNELLNFFTKMTQKIDTHYFNNSILVCKLMQWYSK